MPIKPLPPCSAPACPRLATLRGRCALHQRPTLRQGSMTAMRPDTRPNAQARGYGSEWQRLRAKYLKAHPYCVECGEKGNNVDHIRPKAQGGTDDPSNLQTLCASHHSRKTARHDGAFGNRVKV